MSDVTQDVKARLAQAIHYVMPVDLGPARSMQYSKIAANNVWDKVVEPLVDKVARLSRLSEASGAAFQNLERESDARAAVLGAAQRWAEATEKRGAVPDNEADADYFTPDEIELYKAVKACRAGGES